jgi:hypothetical protein
MIERVNFLVGGVILGVGIGYAARMWWEWWHSRKLRRDISQLVSTLRRQKVRTFRVIENE